MPYRIRDASGPYCHRHEADEAAARCVRCDTPICLICTNETVQGALCDGCHLRHRWRGRLRTSALLTGTLAVVGLLFLGVGRAALWTSAEQNRGALLHDAELKLRDNACDSAAMHLVAETLDSLSRSHEALDRSEDFLRRCGFNELVARDRFHLVAPDGGELALAAALYLAEHAPRSKAYQHQLGVQLARNQRLLEATAVFDRILRQSPWDYDAAVALAAIHDARGYRCEAAAVLADLWRYRQTPVLLSQIYDLRHRGSQEASCGVRW